ncbi:MAG: ParA family protein, partial [Xanthomonadaceae bacterium]|nr:ParA family protein [Xanthomonadaceae bacterium]
MLTTLVASSKGGCGKSTLVTQLASHWAQAGQRTAIIDSDRQGSSS